MSDNKLKLVICWHMHQPWYRESLDGEYRLPWVYLHALKDYSDMVAHLETHREMRAVINFAPILLEQLDDYARQLAQWKETGRAMSEPFLNQLAGIRQIPKDTEQRVVLVEACMRAHAPQMIEPHPAYVELLDLACHKKSKNPDAKKLHYLNDGFFLDLLTWYHLAWLGHSVKQSPLAMELMAQGNGFSIKQRHALLHLMSELFSGLIPRYKALADKDQIELSFTPYAHPIMPLLIDLESMHCALPESPMPKYAAYPKGSERAHWHLQHGIDVFKKYFGKKPQGTWLSEGSISEEAIAMLPAFNLKWTASGEGVWHNSYSLSELDHNNPSARHGLFGPHQLDNTNTHIFFRDDGLSDLIGFEYQDWHADDAVADFMQHLSNIASYLGDKAGEHVVSVILDGENAWEYYPNNAFHFIGALYEQLSKSDIVEVTTFSEAVHCCPVRTLPRLCAGSWVYGSFSTWIGEQGKNIGWEKLIEAKQTYDRVIESEDLNKEQIEKAGMQLAICEGSDWFWWFGDYNPSGSVRDFDTLFRQQLRNLYTLLQQPIPDDLYEPISGGSSDSVANAGTMRRGQDH